MGQASARLRQLLSRTDRVLVLMHPPTARHARLMEAAGVEAGFIGSNGVVTGYTGFDTADSVSFTEALMVGGWIANSVSFPVILDGDNGHGGAVAIRRIVTDCIRLGIAGIRIEDTLAEAGGGGAHGGPVAPLEVAVARYRAAAEVRDELDPDFVVVAHCAAREAPNGGFEETLRRLNTYKDAGHADWVQFGSPKSRDEIVEARAQIQGWFSFIGFNPPAVDGRRHLSVQDHLDLGVTIASFPGFTHDVMLVALWEFLQDFRARDVDAWYDFERQHSGNPYLRHRALELVRHTAEQRGLENVYRRNTSDANGG